jgi:MFS family permease
MTTIDPAAAAAAAPKRDRIGWVTWASLISACLGWMFDALDLQIFTLILFPCVSDLIGTTNAGAVAYTGGLILACKLVAWGLGGIAFGVVADRIGRSKTMVATVLIYSVFTGISGFAQNWWELAICQALAGIGIGGEWAAGAALVAETWPERTRPRAMQVMQMSFAFGYFLAALLNLILGPIGWRWVLAVGALPALVTLFIRQFVPEPERWVEVRKATAASARLVGAQDTAMTTFAAIFAPGIRRRTIVGVLIALTMMIGSWGTSTLLPTWIHQLLPSDQGRAAVKITSQSFMLINVGAVLGYATLIWLTDAIGRRWSYFLVVLGCAAANLYMFTQIETVDGLLAFMVVYGFFAIGGFGTFAAYLPELFPTRIRATGQGFCWNMARVFTAAGPFISGKLVGVFGSVPSAGIMVAWIYVIGVVAIWFGPETKGRPLED